VDLLDFQVPNMAHEMAHVDSDRGNTTPVGALGQVAHRAIEKERALVALRKSSQSTRSISVRRRCSACSCSTAPTRMAMRTPRWRLSMNRYPSARTLIPGVRVQAKVDLRIVGGGPFSCRKKV